MNFNALVFHGASMACSNVEGESCCGFVCCRAVGMLTIEVYAGLHYVSSNCASRIALECVAV